MSAERDIDLFAGPGGWDEGAAELGIRPLGIEWDDAACATRRARGHETLQADVSALDPRKFAPCRLLIGSPPCQAFSMAGKGHGRRALAAYIAAIEQLLATGVIDQEALDEECEDPRGHLVLEPLRWAMQLRPRFVACEQVRPVLPLWEAIAGALRRLGYGTWTGVLSTERFGVPQTRERAILLAVLGGEVSEPPASHQRYVPPRVKAKQDESLFDAPEPERIVLPEDRGLLPWVSMAEALGWDGATYLNGTHDHRAERPMSEPAPSVMFGARLNTVEWRPDDQVGFPRRADSGASVEIDGQDYRGRDFRRASEPAFASTEKARSAVRLRANAQPNAAERSVDEPAPTITGGHDTGDRVWVADDEHPTHYDTRQPGGNQPRPVDAPAPTICGTRLGRGSDAWISAGQEPPTHMNTGRDWKAGGSREDAQKIPTSEPSPAVTAKLGGQAQWVTERPATTVAGDPQVFPPGHKLNADDERAGRGGQRRSGAGWVQARPATTLRTSAEVHGPTYTDRDPDWMPGDPEPSQATGAVRVSVDEAAVLQGFPVGYPWQGSRTAQYRQIGDAVPPPFARAILAHLTAQP